VCNIEQSWFVVVFTLTSVEVPLLGGELMESETIKLAGTIRKIIDRSVAKQPELAQIALDGAGHLYDEVRIPNVHGWEVGKTVEVIIRLT
jgi:hypothetical protein